ncbi:MAG: VanW family protein [Clostridiaceae bacterium]|jgi:vancomycin resistance protein YoaR|nr:VanW family protein [Clostridiaceae bacterium]
MNKKNYHITLKTKILILELFICSVGSFIGFDLKTQMESKRWENLIYPGVEVSGINLCGKTLEESRNILKIKYITPILMKRTNIIVNGKTYTLDNSKLISNYNINDITDSAFHFGKNFTPFKKNLILKKPVLQQYNITFSFNEDYINDSIKTIRSSINQYPLNASIHYTEDGTVKISPDSKGLRLNEAKLKEEIKKSINSKSISDAKIDAPIEETYAKITADSLSKLSSRIASFSTSFSSSSFARAHNIELSASLINGKLIMPGEIFSFNKSVGERTKERGFMEAPVIVGYSVDSGLGGGICQVSSTLYNAILRTGITSIERTHHSLPSSYVPLGLDATVDWNDIDYKFKNTLDYPIYIEAYTENKVLNINIYSNSSLAVKKYTIVNNVYDTIQTNTKIIDNPSLHQGQISITQKGYPGYRVKVLRYSYENGLLINSETISDDLYSPVPSVISRGVGSFK